MKIEIGMWVTFLHEEKGVVAIRRGEVINRLMRRNPSGEVDDFVTVEYDENGEKRSKVVDSTAVYSSKWDAAVALYKQVAPIVEPFYEHEVRTSAPRKTDND